VNSPVNFSGGSSLFPFLESMGGSIDTKRTDL
jgi:hypothetical protein